MEQSEAHRAAEPAAIWLAPGAALAQFEPAEGAHQAAAGRVRQETRARYGFRVGDWGLLIDPDAGSEVLSMPKIASLPGMPPGFLGLVNLRGNLVPIYELRVLLGIEARPDVSASRGVGANRDVSANRAGVASRVLIFGQGEQAVGVIMDGYPAALAALRPLSQLPPLPEVLQKHVAAGYVQDNTVWLEFNHSTFFAEISGSTAPPQHEAALDD